MNVHVAAKGKISSHMHSFQDEAEKANNALLSFLSTVLKLQSQTGNNNFRN